MQPAREPVLAQVQVMPRVQPRERARLQAWALPPLQARGRALRPAAEAPCLG